MKTRCPSCDSDSLYPVLEFLGIPGNSCQLLTSPEKATAVPIGDFVLRVCLGCGLYFNAAYNSALCHYDGNYEETQGYSPSFCQYLSLLVDDLVQRHDLKQKNLLEIGCGKGEFLALLCEHGENSGSGYDPVFCPDRHPNPELKGLQYFQENFTGYKDERAFDAIFTRMTLEHIPGIAEFLAMVRDGLPALQPPLVYTQVPNSALLLDRGLVCDLVYEHCNYFTEHSLTHALVHSGFNVTNTIYSFDSQHLGIEAYPASGKKAPKGITTSSVKRQADAFRSRIDAHLERWNKHLREFRDARKSVIIWGSGSKATAFLSMHECGEEILGVIDINPNRHGTYMAGASHRILGPDALMPGGAMSPFDAVIVMNPVYIQEIRVMLENMNLDPEIMTL